MNPRKKRYPRSKKKNPYGWYVRAYHKEGWQRELIKVMLSQRYNRELISIVERVRKKVGRTVDGN